MEKEVVADGQRTAEMEAVECLRLEDLTRKGVSVLALTGVDRRRLTERG